MRIVVDENIPKRTVRALDSLGNVVLDLRGTPEQGVTDDVLWNVAQGQTALLISTDKGFVRRRDEPHCGILVVRLRQPNREKIHCRIMQAIGIFPEASWPGQTVVMRDHVFSVYRRTHN